MPTPALFPPEYYAVSPVRGHLEPHDPASPANWRYLQTTDTPNELKVLLPPAISSQYDQLLRLELAELAKRPHVVWDRVLEIRHLKERMMRKAQRLSRILPPKRIGRGEPFVFQTLVAPDDFRLKEMENWFLQEARTAKTAVPAPPPKSIPKSIPKHVPPPVSSSSSSPPAPKRVSRNTCCAQCSRSTEPVPIVPLHHRPCADPADHPSDPPSPEPITSPEPSPPPAQDVPIPPDTPLLEASMTPPQSRSPSPSPTSSPNRAASPEVTLPETDTPLTHSVILEPTPTLPLELDGVYSSDSSTVAPTPPPSPPPLPHLLRISDPSRVKDLFDAEIAPEHIVPVVPIDTAEPILATVTISEPESEPVVVEPTPIPLRTARAKETTIETEHVLPVEPPVPIRPSLARRRSCIKRSSGDSVKTVSWADDHNITDQIAKIAFFTTEPRMDESEELEEKGYDPLSSLDSLHLELKKSLEEVQADSSHFELIESLILEHKEKMRNGTHEPYHLPSTMMEKVFEDDEDLKVDDSDDEDDSEL